MNPTTESIQDLIRQVDPKVRKYAHRLTFGNKELSDDIVQDFYEVVFRNPEKYLSGLFVNRFIYNGLRNALTNYLSKYREHPERQTSEEQDYFLATLKSHHSTIEEALDAEAIRAFFLPPSQEQQKVDKVRSLKKQGFPRREIMKMMGLSLKQYERYSNGVTRKEDWNTRIYTKMLFDGYNSEDIARETGNKMETVVATVTYLRSKMRAQFSKFDQVCLCG